MAQYRNGLKTQSLITDTVDENFNYAFWVQKGMGRFPKFDEETKESHLESLFALEYDEERLRKIHSRDHESGGNIYGPNTYSYYTTPHHVEREFLRRVKAKLEAANVPCSFIAQGSCSRRGKQAWTFRTVGYFIKAEKNSVLLKLMGVEQLIEEVWKSLEDEVAVYYDAYITEKKRVDAINNAIWYAKREITKADQNIASAQRNREYGLKLIREADELEAQSLQDANKAKEELERLTAAL